MVIINFNNKEKDMKHAVMHVSANDTLFFYQP